MHMTKKQLDKLEEASKPVQQFLRENCHPHCCVSITQEQIALREDVGVINIPHTEMCAVNTFPPGNCNCK